MAFQLDRIGTIRTIAYHGIPVFFDQLRVPEGDGVHFGYLEQASLCRTMVVANPPSPRCHRAGDDLYGSSLRLPTRSASQNPVRRVPGGAG